MLVKAGFGSGVELTPAVDDPDRLLPVEGVGFDWLVFVGCDWLALVGCNWLVFVGWNVSSLAASNAFLNWEAISAVLNRMAKVSLVGSVSE